MLRTSGNVRYGNEFRRRISGAAVASAVALLAGCVPPPVAHPAAIHAAPDTAAYNRARMPGTATITGQAFLRTYGGRVMLGSGFPVTLDLATPYTMEWARVADANPDIQPQTDSAFVHGERRTVVDAQGNFEFDSIPAGTYLLRSVVAWVPRAPIAVQGGIVADTVTVADGEHRRVILNNVVEPGHALRTSILTAAQVGNRKYTDLGLVDGLSCEVDYKRIEPTEGDARADLIANANKIGADAVINVACEPGGRNIRHGCIATFNCKGDAIQWL